MFVLTEDLIQSCPVWQVIYRPGEPPEKLIRYRQLRAIREAWSHQRVEIAAPSDRGSSHKEFNERWFCDNRCCSTVYWKVIGPPTLLAELAAIPPHPNSGAEPPALYLCQHEICGD